MPLPQWNHETPQSWLSAKPRFAAAMNGAAMGAAFTSRIGFWLWYVVPVAALLSGSVAMGAAIYGTYAVSRVVGTSILLVSRVRLSQRLNRRFTAVSDLILSKRATARHVAALQLTAVGVVAVVAFNL